jgi:hypothetical protein
MDGSPFSVVVTPLKMKGAENRAFRRPWADQSQGWVGWQSEAIRGWIAIFSGGYTFENEGSRKPRFSAAVGRPIPGMGWSAI